MKKKLLSLSVVAICLAIMASGTIAYFAADERVHNTITASGIDIGIIEKTKDAGGALIDFPTEGISGVMPGTTVSKIVTVENSGGAAAWIRVAVEQRITAKNGEELSTLLNDTVPAITFAVDPEMWTWQDGWYYYQRIVDPLEATEVLFEEVRFAPEMGNDYQECTANLIISAQAVQSANNGETVLDALGWPEEVTE